MDHVARMNVLRGVQQLVHHESFVNVLQNRSAFDDVVEIALHEFERQVNVHVVHGADRFIV